MDKCCKCKDDDCELYTCHPEENEIKWYCLECYEKKFGKWEEYVPNTDGKD